jgi:hypothetical protein
MLLTCNNACAPNLEFPVASFVDGGSVAVEEKSGTGVPAGAAAAFPFIIGYETDQ